MRVDDLNSHLGHRVVSHKKGPCPGCPQCQRIKSGKSGKGSALRLAVKAQEIQKENPSED